MLWARTLLLICLATPAPGIAILSATAPAYANECEDAGHAAERAAALPADLLLAVGRVESGRRTADGRVAPWPWSVNAAGQGYYLPTRDAAVALVRTFQARGVQSIDVGCFQMNLLYHPAAFASLEDAFDPSSNAHAAAAFLSALQAASPGWSQSGWSHAIGSYHSTDPARAIPYARLVMASWHGGADMPSPPLSQVALLVRVYVPGGSAAGLVRNAAGHLPVVIVPSGSHL